MVHELTHIIFREYVKADNLPLWLDEGMATYMENKYGKKNYQKGIPYLKKKLEKGEYIKLSELSDITYVGIKNKDSEWVSFFYLQCYSIVNFLIKEYDNYRFYNFLRELRKGRSISEALAKIFYSLKDFDELERRWKEFYLGSKIFIWSAWAAQA